MKGIDKRIAKDGSISYRARVRIKGHPILSKTFSSMTLAKQWKKETEVEIEKGRYFDRIEAQKHTLGEAVDRYIKHILFSKPKNAKNVRHHLLWWKERLGAYSLDAIKRYSKKWTFAPRRYNHDPSIHNFDPKTIGIDADVMLILLDMVRPSLCNIT